jgi:glycosyltransferase involved in cell wall biosynthesis
MTIVVIVCTYNRCQSLGKALESVAVSIVDAWIKWNVLVVDNNSSDQTQSVVQDYCRRFPERFQYHFESRQGKSFALNAGIQRAKADILAFVDDDVQVDAYWLNNLAGVFVNSNWSGVGGRILPEAGFVPPAWMDTRTPYALAPLAIFDRGLKAEELNESPYGTNMAFRREVFSTHGGFRTDLGPLPGSDIRHNEDSEFGSRLLLAGERLWYEPSAVVYHAVPADRREKAYFLAWWYDKARADIRQDGIPIGLISIAGVPLLLIRRMGLWCLRWILEVQPARRFSSKLTVWRIAAMIRECRRVNRLARLEQGRSFAAVPPQPRKSRLGKFGQ